MWHLAMPEKKVMTGKKKKKQWKCISCPESTGLLGEGKIMLWVGKIYTPAKWFWNQAREHLGENKERGQHGGITEGRTT